MNGLTNKQETLIKEYSIDSNGFRAAVAAGYSPKTAKVIASQTLTKVNVAAALQKVKESYAKKVDVRKDKRIKELEYVAYSNLKGLFKNDLDGYMIVRSLEEIDDELWPAIQEIKTFSMPDGNGTGFQVKLYDKLKSHRLLGEMFGDFKNGGAPAGDSPNRNITININPVTVNGNGN